MTSSETTARLEADPSLTSVVVAYYLSDSSTAIATYPYDSGLDAVESVQNLLSEKRRTGSDLAVDSLNSDASKGECFINPAHVVGYVVSAGA